MTPVVCGIKSSLTYLLEQKPGFGGLKLPLQANSKKTKINMDEGPYHRELKNNSYR